MHVERECGGQKRAGLWRGGRNVESVGGIVVSGAEKSSEGVEKNRVTETSNRIREERRQATTFSLDAFHTPLFDAVPVHVVLLRISSTSLITGPAAGECTAD